MRQVCLLLTLCTCNFLSLFVPATNDAYSLRSLFGAAFPLFTAQMYQNLGINWASTLVAFLALACTPMPFLFYKFGGRIRANCKYAAEAAGFAQMMKDRAIKQRELEKKHEHSTAADPEKPKEEA
jgi:hypothetical protein